EFDLLFQAAWITFGEALAAGSPMAEAGAAFSLQAEAFAALDRPDLETVARLNELALASAEGPETPEGAVPLAPDPRVAAEKLLTEDDLDEHTRQRLWDALGVFEEGISRFVSAIDNYEAALATAVDQRLAAIDAFVAGLESLISH
nr:hypothetical protein [Longispora sp. (in: high G+C Gram-positive bacteria)]